MDLKSYSAIIVVVTIVPALVVSIILCVIWHFYRNSEALMLIVMKNIVSKKNIDRTPTYLVCNRVLKEADRRKFMLTTIFISSICVQTFFLLSVVNVTYNCINDPHLDCFKKKDHVDVSDAYDYNESPVNCSSISRHDFVICYRITIFDPKRGFIGAAAAYLLFKMLNFGLLIVAHVMLGVAQKWEQKIILCLKTVFSLLVITVLIVPLILRINLDQFESALRKVSYTALVQVALVVLVIVQFIARLPWEEFEKSPQYFAVVSLPDNDMQGESVPMNNQTSSSN